MKTGIDLDHMISNRKPSEEYEIIQMINLQPWTNQTARRHGEELEQLQSSDREGKQV